MICECGSERIQWDRSLTETQCPDCGGRNCQKLDEPYEEPMTTPLPALLPCRCGNGTPVFQRSFNGANYSGPAYRVVLLCEKCKISYAREHDIPNTAEQNVIMDWNHWAGQAAEAQPAGDADEHPEDAYAEYLRDFHNATALDTAHAKLAEMTKDRDEWADSCKAANKRFLKAESQLAEARQDAAGLRGRKVNVHQIAEAVWKTANRREQLGSMESIEFWGVGEIANNLGAALKAAGIEVEP